MGKKEQKLDKFDSALARGRADTPWDGAGRYRADYALLKSLLGIAAGSPQQSGTVAAAVDVWAAQELRRAGFDEDDVWPRAAQPRVLPRDIRNFVKTLPKGLQAEIEARYTRASSRKALPAEPHVLGSVYTKQADVVVASWVAGVELLVSTKTMLSSYQKNLRNRFEEAYGDAKNLRGRHPLAALGFIFVVGADIPETSFDFATDMLAKLVREHDVYDCAGLLVVRGAEGAADDAPRDERGPDEEPPGLVPLAGPVDDDADELQDPEATGTDGPQPKDVALELERVPPHLSPDVFFHDLIQAALERMPVTAYGEARRRLNAAQDGSAPPTP
ncbi:MAG: hypothetical protein M3157_07450 [Actinomycetota bacterium]|nr:hypothetical protein [Actinomycetota bacterium]